MEKPEVVTEEHMEYLNELRESGETNMFGARPYLKNAFPELTRQQTAEVLIYWMKTFKSRNEEKK